METMKQLAKFKELPYVFGTADDILITGYEESGKTMTEQYARYYKYVER